MLRRCFVLFLILATRTSTKIFCATAASVNISSILLYRKSTTFAIVMYRRSPSRRIVRKSELILHLATYSSITKKSIWIQTPMQWNSIVLSRTASHPVLSPNIILSPPGTHCAFIPEWKFRRDFQKYYFRCFCFLK
jgi:hypothetical protein